MVSFLLSAAMLAVFALVYGAIRLWIAEDTGRKPVLMIAAALVILVNIIIWALPDSNGNSLLQEAQRPEAAI